MMRVSTLAIWGTIVARGLTRFDLLERRVCLLINRGARPLWIRRFFVVVSRLGNGPIWIILMAVLASTQGSAGRVAAAQMAIGGLIGLGLYKFLKAHLVRERPFIVNPAIQADTPPLDRYSFPSGHTLHAVMFTIITVAWFPLLAALLIPFALFIGLSRVVLGLHYPTDVLVGALIGWGLAEIALLAEPPSGLA